MSCGNKSAALLAADRAEAIPVVAACEAPSSVGVGPSKILKIGLAV